MIRNFRGNVIYVGEMQADRYQGKGTIYFERTGKPKETGIFKGGLLNCDYGIRYNEEGGIKEEGRFVDGVRVPQ